MTTLSLSSDQVKRMYRSVKLIRCTEEKIAHVYPTDLIKSPIHLSIGQEAVSVGVCDLLDEHDVVYGTYRGHALYLAKGGNLKKMIAELFGRETGCAAGKAGSMHLIDTSVNVMGTPAIVATNIPLALGHAFAIKSMGLGGIVACFFGEGASDEGAFHESVNFASLKNLPVLFVCENNQLAIHSRIENRMAGPGLVERFRSYGIEGQQITDGNIISIRHAAGAYIKTVRSGNGPRFLECLTYRWREHVGPAEDWDAEYRSEREKLDALANDPVMFLADLLEEPERKTIDCEISVAIEEAFSLAKAAPYPERDALKDHVYG